MNAREIRQKFNSAVEDLHESRRLYLSAKENLREIQQELTAYVRSLNYAINACDISSDADRFDEIGEDDLPDLNFGD